MSSKRFNKPEFTFIVPTPKEMIEKIKVLEEEGKPIPEDFFEQVKKVEKARQYEIYLEERIKHREAIKKLMVIK